MAKDVGEVEKQVPFPKCTTNVDQQNPAESGGGKI